MPALEIASAPRPFAQGRRPSWSERRPDLVSKIFAILVPLGFLFAGAGFGWVSWEGASEHPVMAVGCALLGIVSLALLAFGDLYGVGGWWYSACPVCGHEAARDYFRGRSAACDSCVAYLRLEDGKVIEESDEAVEFMATYGVRPADLLGRDPKTLVFPDGCALCGMPATAHREVRGQLDRQIRELTGPSASEGPQSPAGFDWDLRVPVCERHLHEGAAPVETWRDELQFRSYERYRAFCRKNGIEKRARS
jgi:hypothetical protein